MERPDVWRADTLAVLLSRTRPVYDITPTGGRVVVRRRRQARAAATGVSRSLGALTAEATDERYHV